MFIHICIHPHKHGKGSCRLFFTSFPVSWIFPQWDGPISAKPITIHHLFEKDLAQRLDQRFSQYYLRKLRQKPTWESGFRFLGNRVWFLLDFSKKWLESEVESCWTGSLSRDPKQSQRSSIIIIRIKHVGLSENKGSQNPVVSHHFSNSNGHFGVYPVYPISDKPISPRGPWSCRVWSFAHGAADVFPVPPFDEIHGSSGSHPMHGIHRWKRRRMAGSVLRCGPQGPGLLHQGPGQHDFGRSDERPRQPLFAAHQNLPKRFGCSGSSGRRMLLFERDPLRGV
jgi:hypothetical protein